MNMRRYHRWLAPLFAVILLWIAVTGLTIQFIKLSTPARPGPAASEEEASRTTLIPAAQAHEHDEVAKPPIAAAPTPALNAAPPAAKPETDIDRIRRERHDLSEFVMDLHSGKVLGTFGTWLSIVSGVVLIFLAGSGLWMYVQMYRRREHRHSHPRRLFW